MDEAPTGRGRGKGGKKGRGVSKKGSSSELPRLARKRRISAQIETLLEFSELHLIHMNGNAGEDEDSLQLVGLLADACLACPGKSGMCIYYRYRIVLLVCGACEPSPPRPSTSSIHQQPYPPLRTSSCAPVTPEQASCWTGK